MRNIPKLSKYSGFLFDFDGTLFPFIWPEVYRKYIHKHGAIADKNFYEQRDRLAEKHRKAPNYYEAIFEEINNIYGINLSGKEGVDQAYKIADYLMRTDNYKAGADKLLHFLRDRKKKLGIVTSTTTQAVKVYANENQNVKNSADINLIFGENIITCDMITERKPAPDMYLAGLEMLGLEAKDVLAFEDSLHGAVSSTCAGIDTCIIYDAASDKDREKLRDRTPFHINSFTELLRNQ